MRTVSTEEVEEAVERLFVKANYFLPDSLKNAIEKAKDAEDNALAKSVLGKLTDNLEAAAQIGVPVCQDTGMAILFAEIGQEVHFEGKPFEEAVNSGVAKAYVNGYMRKSVVRDQLFDKVNTNDNTPAIIYTKIVAGDKVKLTAAPKGFGSENMSAIKMFTPSATQDDVVEFVLETMRNAGGNPCPPVVLGIGIGGSFEYCTYLAKKALTRNIDIRNSDSNYARLEERILTEVNRLNIGPQGFGGRTTALAVNIESFPTHIAGLPVAVNVGCHVTRHSECII